MGTLSEVLRRFVFVSELASTLMMSFGLVALIANDVVANFGVILAGLLVAWTVSRYPDLIIGMIIGVIVLSGVHRILQLKF